MTWRLNPELLPSESFRREGESGGVRIVVPESANIAADTVARHAAGPRAGHTALAFEREDGSLRTYSFAEVDELATRLAVKLRQLGVGRGDRVAVHSVQRPETVIAHMAVYKLAAIATTVSQLTGPDTMAYVLNDCGARVVVTQDTVWDPFRKLRGDFTALEQVLVVGDAAQGELSFDDCLATDPGDFRPEETAARDPALLIYTSGSTGHPKGILHGHGILHALNATIELFYNLELRDPDRVLWTAADWAWIGGLNDVVFPALTFGHTLMVSQHRYDAEWALEFMARHGVTHILLTPTALKRIARVPRARERYDLKLRVIFTGGEALPGETHRALSENLGVVCNEGYGMSEVNQMIGNCGKLRPIRPGSMGWKLPGHEVALFDEEGREVPDGEVGEIVVGADDPTLFLGYWGRPELTDSLRLGDRWMRSHDLARRDADGYYWYQGRNDDLIKSAGFRIGPAEVEEALFQHPAVADSGVIGVPDTGDRGNLVKAFILLADGYQPNDDLAEQLRQHVKARIGPFKQPRLIEFVDDLPTTRTGKIARAELRRMEAARASAAK